jgi:hypothetical protein
LTIVLERDEIRDKGGVMSHQVTVELSDVAFAALESEASASARPVEQVAAAALEQRFVGNGRKPDTDAEKQAARDRFRSNFGAIDLGYATGLDNEAIDADLAREYGRGLDGD